jgi:hypothetical protein
MMQKRFFSLVGVLLVPALFALAGCSTSIPFLGVKVKVVDENNAPLAGATVSTSGGDLQTTGTSGEISLKFSRLTGTYIINVDAPGRMPSVLTATLPLDVGKELVARLPKVIDTGAAAGNGAAAAHSSTGIGAGLGGMFGANFGNMLMAQLYPLMFQYLFTANGYSLDFAPYQPGQWTEWQIASSADDDGQMVMRKAFLKRLENKQEWWQVRLKGDQGEKDMLFEVLFSVDRQSIRRMRNLGADGKPAEVPVSEGWYTPPQKLTPESLEGSLAKKGDSVKVPAGSYKADLYEFSNYGAGKVRMWRAKGVPGELVKSQVTSGDDSNSWNTELLKFGADAKSELASF